MTEEITRCDCCGGLVSYLDLIFVKYNEDGDLIELICKSCKDFEDIQQIRPN